MIKIKTYWGDLMFLKKAIDLPTYVPSELPPAGA